MSYFKFRLNKNYINAISFAKCILGSIYKHEWILTDVNEDKGFFIKHKTDSKLDEWIPLIYLSDFCIVINKEYADNNNIQYIDDGKSIKIDSNYYIGHEVPGIDVR